jgi:hypothetical protein
VIFAVSPASNGNWMVDTMPPEPGSFGQRLALPEPWAGLQAEELVKETGVADAVFVHVRRFVGAAKSRSGRRRTGAQGTHHGGIRQPISSEGENIQGFATVAYPPGNNGQHAKLPTTGEGRCALARLGTNVEAEKRMF